MTDDITFCANECKNKKCRRHRSNIREPQYPHSIALLEGTEYCEKKPTSKPVRLIDADRLKDKLVGLRDYRRVCEIINNAPTVVNIGTIYRNESCPNKSRCIDYIGYHCEGCNAVEPKRPQDKQRGTDVISYIDGLIDGVEAVRPQGKTNAEIFKQTFGIYATELWSMKEADFLMWLNAKARGAE